jgi:hydroxyacylglutathione hydrolase
VLVAGFPSMAFGTNCYVVAAAPGNECVVVDPGIQVVEQLESVLREHRLKPVAVLLTHGHLDHTFSVAPVTGARGIPAYIHPDDRELLADPSKALSMDMTQLFGGRLAWSEPDEVKPLGDGEPLRIAGLEITVDHAPGHTRGSVMFRTPAEADGPSELLFSGDVLFAGSIGRTDLPGGDHPTMLHSLATKILPLADDIVVLPGHGPRTTIGRERVSNPFLAELRSATTNADVPGTGPHRGL